MYRIEQYVFQTLFHSFLIALIVEVLLRFWREGRPAVRLRFFFLVVWLPVLLFPFFHVMDPSRGDYHFRTEAALFDLNAWLLLRLWNGILLWHVAAFILTGAAFIFFVQDFGPVLRLNFERRKNREPYAPGTIDKVDHAIRRLDPSRTIQILLLSSREPLLFCRGLRRPAICISRGLIDLLDQDELEGVIAHETWHITLKDHIAGWVLLIFRVLAFFNPVALIEFRRMILEREKLCDDQAVHITGKPMALSSGLIKFFRLQESATGVSIRNRLRLHSQRIHIEDRVARLVRPQQNEIRPFPQFRIGVTIVAVSVLLFFVV